MRKRVVFYVLLCLLCSFVLAPFSPRSEAVQVAPNDEQTGVESEKKDDSESDQRDETDEPSTPDAASSSAVEVKKVQSSEGKLPDDTDLRNLTFSLGSYPAKVLGTGTFRILEPLFVGMACQYRSANEKVATVDSSGVVTPVGSGITSIHVTVTDAFGRQYQYDIPIQILEPHFENTKIAVARGCERQMPFLDATGLSLVCTSSDSQVVSIQGTDETGVKISANKTGTATLTATAEGVSFSCEIIVTDPVIKTTYGFYQKKKSVSVKVTGTNSISDLQWSSSDKSVATVTSKGKVKTLKLGSAVISCVADGKVLEYYIAVGTKTSVKAMRWGYKQLGKKKYSQARRMSANYFDCSSFVYRSYRAAGKYLVRRTSWAPVAADIGHFYVKKGKQVKTSSKTYNWNKLRPGDLICFGGSSARRNGRYKRIYHIALYIGNGKTMESSSLYNNVVIRDREPLKKKDVPVIVRPA